MGKLVHTRKHYTMLGRPAKDKFDPLVSYKGKNVNWNLHQVENRQDVVEVVDRDLEELLELSADGGQVLDPVTMVLTKVLKIFLRL